MQVCTHCGKESRDDDMFCLHCGQRLATPPSIAPQASSDTPKGWVWPWQRAGQGEVVAPATAAVDVAVREPVNGSAPNVEPIPTASARLILEAADGSGQARDYILDGRNVTIGRAPACTVSLPEDQLASRLHAMLHFTGEQYTISDLGSSNGTLVNGALIRGATPLSAGDRITVGQHILIYTTAQDAQASASFGAREQEAAPDPAQQTTVPPAFETSAAPAAATSADEQEVEPPAAWQEWTSSAAENDPSPASVPEPEPEASPVPTWQPTGSDPWVMPAPPQWAAGPGSDVWSVPDEVQVEPQPGAEAPAPKRQRPDEQDAFAVSQEDTAPWAIEPSPWNGDGGAGERVTPLPSTATAAGAPWGQDDRQASGGERSGAATSPTASAEPGMEEGPATGELDVVRSQLVRSSELLSKWTQSTASHTRQLRAELAALAQDISAALADPQGLGAGAAAHLEELVHVAEDAARDPHHVDTVVALARRSSEVASALKTQHELLAALMRVRDRLNELAR